MNEEQHNVIEPKKLAYIIESILFISGESLSIKKLTEICSVTENEVESAIILLKGSLDDRGIRLLQKEDILSLVTAPELTPYIEKFIKDEVMGDLSKAALETITIIAYKHPISRPEIDYIRGVNSAFTLRNLIMRGLVERVPSRKESRTYLYRPTIEFMKFLGLSSFDDLPQYKDFRKELEKGIEQQSENK